MLRDPEQGHQGTPLTSSTSFNSHVGQKGKWSSCSNPTGCFGDSKWDKGADFIETVDILSRHARFKAGIPVHGETNNNGECCVRTAGKSRSWWKDSNVCWSSRKSLKTPFCSKHEQAVLRVRWLLTQLKKALGSGSVLRISKARSSNILQKSTWDNSRGFLCENHKLQWMVH